jgi:hypothetical protein
LALEERHLLIHAREPRVHLRDLDVLRSDCGLLHGHVLAHFSAKLVQTVQLSVLFGSTHAIGPVGQVPNAVEEACAGRILRAGAAGDE